MSLQPGDRVGTFEILSTLGAGGMGVVYRARDTRLGREVAIKTLPDSLAGDPVRLQRFEREAKALGALSHPNVATLYGFFSEPEQGASLLVMEMVEGETLADRFRRGRLSVREVASLFVQIAEGLEAAHEKGFIHRDLKPANIKIAPDGRVKILDFGLAKARVEAPMDDLTAEGGVIGTAAFMSPEQLEGTPLDRRADVWAFGVCLYEALTGKRPFSGDSLPQVLVAVLKREVDWEALPAETPAPLERLLRRCLEKERRQRLSDLGDARLDLLEALGEESASAARTADGLRSLLRRRPLWSLAAGLAGVAALLVALRLGAGWLSSAGARPVSRLSLAWAAEPLARRVGLDREVEFAALSPDGRSIVYRSDGLLHLRRLEALESITLPGTEPGIGPFFSPDGKWVGYFTDTELKKVSIHGGEPQTLGKVSAGHCGTWGADDTIVIGRSGLTALWRVKAGRGVPQPLTERSSDEVDHDWPSILPGGNAVLFTDAAPSYGPGEARIVAQSLVTSERKILVEGGTYPRYSPSGHLLYAHDGGIYAARFDADRLEVIGRPVRVVDELQQGWNNAAQFSVSGDGTLLYVRGTTSSPRARPVWVDRSSHEIETPIAANHFAYPTLSPDGSRLAVEVRDTTGPALWVYELTTGRGSRLTFHLPLVSGLVWSLDGQDVYFSTTGTGGANKVYRKRSDGTGSVETLAEASVRPRSLSPSDQLVGIGFGRDTDRDIVMIDLTAPAEPRPLLASAAREIEPQVSADGRWIAYVSDESGRNEIYVRPFPNVADGQWQVSTRGGLCPRWNPNGGELFFLEGNSLMAVGIEDEGAFRSGAPTQLASGAYVGSRGGYGGFDVSPDGERFLVHKQVIEPGEAGELILVLNWFAELDRLVPLRQ